MSRPTTEDELRCVISDLITQASALQAQLEAEQTLTKFFRVRYENVSKERNALRAQVEAQAAALKALRGVIVTEINKADPTKPSIVDRALLAGLCDWQGKPTPLLTGEPE